MRETISINGVTLPFAPVSMNVTKSDLFSDNTKRGAETGRLLLYPIRKDVYTLELEFLLNPEQKEILDSCLEDYEMQVTFIYNSKQISRRMYASDRTESVLGTPENRFFSVSFSLIEL